MIFFIDYQNMHLHGSLLLSQHQLRYKSFVERQNYDVFNYKELEYDQYDTPSAKYIVYKSAKDHAIGVCRLTPVSHRSMLQDLFPEMVDDHNIFLEKDIWEGTRFCVEKNLPPEVREKVIRDLVNAYFVFSFKNKISSIIGIMPSYILRQVFKKNGCAYRYLGKPKLIDGQRIQAAILNITQENYENFKKLDKQEIFTRKKVAA